MGLNRRLVYDTLHKSVVTFLIGFTGVGTVWLTYKGFNWYLYAGMLYFLLFELLAQLTFKSRLKTYLFDKRPLITNERRRRVEDKVAAEQTEQERELLKLQKEAETLKD